MSGQAQKGRGRTRSDQTTSQAQSSRVEVTQDRAVAAHSADRPARVPMGATLKLSFDHLCGDENYHYRVFSDRDGRIEQAKRAYYEHVVEDGNNAVRHIGEYKQFLMRIEKRYWKQDQVLKQKRITATLQEEQKLKQDEYLPDGRHHVLEKDEYDPLS